MASDPDQGLHAFIGYQNFVGDVNKLIAELKGADPSITAPRIKAFVDNRLAAMHGRGPADAAGGVVSSEMGKAADENASIRTGTRALVLYVRPYPSHTNNPTLCLVVSIAVAPHLTANS